jgi:pantoate--beta-alanine ligase
MNIVSELKEWQALRKKLGDTSIGFVPTMGHLHAGHLSLCKRAMQENTVTVVSIFINPTQFNSLDDFTAYPRTLEQDKILLAGQGVDYLFLPDKQSLYPDDYQVQVEETQLSQILEGAYRPGHFKGMLTVVLKLLNLVQPQKTYVGEKDYQQYLLIQKMAQALFLSTEIIACQTVRNEQGLALSSRNSRLSPEQQEKAARFAQCLKQGLTLDGIKQELNDLGMSIDYIAEHWGRRLGAVCIDNVRLIDNIELK